MPRGQRTLKEQARLAALHDLNILDSDVEPAFEDMLDLLLQSVSSTAGGIFFVSDSKAWFKALRGLSDGPELQDNPLFTNAILNHQARVIKCAENGSFGERTGSLNVDGWQSLLSAPIRLESGHIVGAVCALSKRLENWSDYHIAQVERTARIISQYLEARRGQLEMHRAVFLERALLRAQSRYETIFNSVSDGIVVISRDGAVIECNDAACRHLDLNQGDIFGCKPSPTYQGRRIVDANGQTVPSDHRPSSIALRTGDQTDCITYGFEDTNGIFRWLTEQAIPIRPADSSKPIAAICILRPTAAPQNMPLQFPTPLSA